jgi:hypothetical protein
VHVCTTRGGSVCVGSVCGACGVCACVCAGEGGLRGFAGVREVCVCVYVCVFYVSIHVFVTKMQHWCEKKKEIVINRHLSILVCAEG